MSRLFVASTPRAGSTWFRHLLADLLDIGSNSFWFPMSLNWDALPEECMVVMHRRRTTPFEGFLREHHFRFITLARHPLDVLLSILAYARWDLDGTAKWLEGEGGHEASLADATPTSEAFVRYALSWRAEALLDVSVSWASHAVHASYERLVDDPQAELARLCVEVRATPRNDAAVIVARHTPDAMRAVAEHHVWRGQPGLWRRLILPEIARLIRDRHPKAFTAFGYEADADPELTAERAEANWTALS